jgi:hypothetical protein
MVKGKSLYGGQSMDERITNDISQLSNSCFKLVTCVVADDDAKEESTGL